MIRQAQVTLNWYELKAIRAGLDSELDYLPVGSQDYWNARNAGGKINTALAELEFKRRNRKIKQVEDVK